MATATLQKDKGLSAGWSPSTGYTTTLTYDVSGLDSANHESRALEAVTADGIPDPYSAHPDSGTVAAAFGLIAIGFQTRDKDTERYEVTVTFGLPPAGSNLPTEPPLAADAQISVETTVVEIETAYDRHGQQIFTEHVTGKRVYQTVRYFVPSVTITFARREASDPASNAIAYLGKLNSSIVFGDPVRTWMCVHLGGPSDDGGATYLVTYKFQRTSNIGKDHNGGGTVDDAQPWDILIVEKDEEGNLVENPELGAGKKLVEVQGLIEFRDLELTIPVTA